MTSYVLSPSAERDLQEIWEYIASDNIDAADRVIGAIELTLDRLAQHPGLGHIRRELVDSRLRFALVYSYLIAYRYEDRPITIVRVLHAARDVQTILALPSMFSD